MPFVAIGMFHPIDVHLADVIAEAVDEGDDFVILGAALAMRATREGHVCVTLSRVADEFRELERVLPWPSIEDWTASLTRSAAVTSNPTTSLAVRPLVLENGRLYLDRYWNDEHLVATYLRSWASTGQGLFRDKDQIDRWLSCRADVSGDSSSQLAAISSILTDRLTVISGGPGTGKTRTVARALVCVGELAETTASSFRIALAAPTATAAKRVQGALEREFQRSLADPSPTSRVVVSHPVTVHRLLGSRPRRGFMYHRHHSLPFDLVVIDEVSMLSLSLTARLLDALHPDTALVLVGDPFQLASVEAGAVLSELVRTDSTDPAAIPLEKSIVRLEGQHRFGTKSGIAQLAESIRIGDADAALSTLAETEFTDVNWVRENDFVALRALYESVSKAAEDVIEATRAGEISRALRSLGNLKVLCAMHSGPFGTRFWHDTIEQHISAVHPEYFVHRKWYIGRPLIVNHNDYRNNLANGDVGVVSDLLEPSATFLEGTELRKLPISRLRDIETWWAMTIHKSQGSEYGHVVVSLPGAFSMSLSRELLYTAVTRARHRVTIVASPAALRSAILRPARRDSGLGAKLWSATT